MVKCFVNSTEPANPIAESPAATIPKLKSFDQGAVIIRTPEKPTIPVIKRSFVRVPQEIWEIEVLPTEEM